MELRWQDIVVVAVGVLVVLTVAALFLPVLIPVGLIIAFLVLVYLGVRSVIAHPPSRQP